MQSERLLLGLGYGAELLVQRVEDLLGDEVIQQFVTTDKGRVMKRQSCDYRGERSLLHDEAVHVGNDPCELSRRKEREDDEP